MTRKDIDRGGDKIVIFTPLDSPTPVTRADLWKTGERFITWNGAFMQTAKDAIRFRDSLNAAIEEALKP